MVEQKNKINWDAKVTPRPSEKSDISQLRRHFCE